MIVIDGKEVRINRANVAISEIDRIYIDLCKEILEHGVETENRTGINTLAIAGWTAKFNVGEEFPIMESKKVVASNFAKEIQWIHIAQSNDLDWLRDRDNFIWDEWCVDSDGIWREYEQGDNYEENPDKLVIVQRQILDHKNGTVKRVNKLDEFKKPTLVRADKESLERYIKKYGKEPTIKRATYFGEQYSNTIGEQYGFINKTYKQPQCVEQTLKTNPTDRRMIIDLWQKKHFAKAVLPSCVFCMEFTVIGDTLHAFVHQRSADTGAGFPFNVAQYALLFSMYAKANGFKVGTLSWSIMNAHIYVNQIGQIKKQIQRYEYMKEYEKLILTSTDETVEREYNRTAIKFDLLNNKAFELIKYLYQSLARDFTREEFDKMPMSKRYSILKEMEGNQELLDYNFIKEYEEAFERKTSFEHMLTREKPLLELEDHDSVFDYSTEYVKKGDSYLKENPIGNKELVLKNYHPTPFISMPIAQ